MKLSIIIPCYNCSTTISRLLESILANGLDKNDYEVIIVDDNSTDGFLNVVSEYESKMDIVYAQTVRDVHCPGNTREIGLGYVQGEWFMFADNDDMFEPTAFKTGFEYLEEHPETTILSTNFREVIFETGEVVREFKGEDTDTWLHGKFYNTKKVLQGFNAHFKEDLCTHEDVYFNSLCLTHMIDNDTDYAYLPVFTYKWVYNPDSITRSFYRKKHDHTFIEKYMDDYLHAVSDPRIEMFKTTNKQNTVLWCLDQIMMNMLHAYFYYQASVWKLGGAYTLDDCYVALRQFKRRVIEVTGLTEQGMINYVYSKPGKYDEVRKHGIEGVFPFVETQSFRDFILNL